jgi:hypothetical protein
MKKQKCLIILLVLGFFLRAFMIFGHADQSMAGNKMLIILIGDALISRISVNTPAELENQLNKILKYDRGERLFRRWHLFGDCSTPLWKTIPAQTAKGER